MKNRMKESQDSTNISIIVEQLTAADHAQDENICNNNNIEVTYFLRPVAETTLREFIDTCVRNVSNFPDDWHLCTDDGAFNCDPVTDYVHECEMWRSRRCDTDQKHENNACTMGMAISQSSGLLILFSLVFIGVLIGISITIAVCLICPKMHSWANRKIRGSHIYNGKTKPSSVFHLETLDNQTRPVQDYDTQLRHHYSDERGPSLSQSGETDSEDNYTTIGAGADRTSGAPSMTNYEGLTRNNSQQQSHKYAYLPQTVPDERQADIPEDSEQSNSDVHARKSEPINEDVSASSHDYFVLEKSQNN